jgi:hypothetical protein
MCRERQLIDNVHEKSDDMEPEAQTVGLTLEWRRPLHLGQNGGQIACRGRECSINVSFPVRLFFYHFRNTR